MSKPTVLKGPTSATHFQTAVVQAPRYQYYYLPPQTQQNNINTAASGVTLVTFAPPTNVFNWSRSFLSWTDTEAPATNVGATTTCKAIDTFPIQSIRLITLGGKVIVDVPEFRSYAQTMRWIQTDIQKFSTSSVADAMVMSNLPAGTVNKPRASPYPAGSNTTINNPYREGLYTITSTPAGSLAINYRMCLGDVLPYTFFALPQDSHFRTDPLLLQITFCNYDFVRWAIPTGAIDPNTGAVIKTVGANQAAGSALTNIQMNMAVQMNEQLREQTIASMGANFQLSIPYLYSQVNYYTAANTQPTANFPISKGQGQLLRWALTTVYDGTESINTANDMSNEFSSAANLQKVVSYQTLRDMAPIQPFVINCAQGMDYLFNKQFIERSPVGFDPTAYLARWFHLDSFGDETSPASRNTSLTKEAIVGGIGLAATPTQHYFKPILGGSRDVRVKQWYCVQRFLEIKQGGQVEMI